MNESIRKLIQNQSDQYTLVAEQELEKLVLQVAQDYYRFGISQCATIVEQVSHAILEEKHQDTQVIGDQHAKVRLCRSLTQCFRDLIGEKNQVENKLKATVKEKSREKSNGRVPRTKRSHNSQKEKKS